MSFRRITRTSQPPAGTNLDVSKPLCRGLYGAIHMAYGEYLWGGKVALRLFLDYDAIPTPTPYGIAAQRANENWMSLRLMRSPYSPAGNSSGTVMALHMLRARTISASGVTLANASQNNNSVNFATQTLSPGGSTIIQGRAFLDGGTRVFGATPVTDAMLGKPLVTLMRHDNVGGEQSLWVNGVKDPQTLAFSGATSVGRDWVGQQAASSYGHGYLMLVWDRALSDAEIRSVSANPWQVFEPVRVPIFVGNGVTNPQWEDIPGETSSSYTTPPVTAGMNGWKYRLIATNIAGSATSNEALLTVTSSPGPSSRRRLILIN